MSSPVALVLLGGLIGVYGTLVGAGGGFLLVPLLLFLDPASPPVSLTGISLSIVAANAASGSLAYARKGRIDYGLALALSVANIPGTVIGALLTAYVRRQVFEVSFGALMLLLGALIMWRPVRPAISSQLRLATSVLPVPSPGHLSVGILVSFVVGLVSGVLGIGGSPLQVIVLTHLMRVPVHLAMPTAQLMVLLSTVGAVLAHVIGGHFAPALGMLLWLGIGAVVGAQLGAALSDRFSSGMLVRLMAVALVTVGIRLMLAPFW